MVTQREYARRAPAVAGLVLLAALLLSLVSPAAAGAAPKRPGTPAATPAAKSAPNAAARATPAAATKTPPPPGLRLKLPGLLDVQVTLPDLGRVLGGRPAATAPAAATTVPAPAPAPATEPAPRPTTRPQPRTTAPTRTAKPRRPAPTRTPERARIADTRVEGGAGPRQERPDRPRSSTATPAPQRRATALPEAVEFQRMLRGETPIWLLASVIGALVLGTALVVRSAGRRTPGAHRTR